jgi:hypothetical protein
MTYVTVGIASQHYYLGPCLAPAEVEALQADLGAQFERAKLSEILHNQHVTKLEIENARLREALSECNVWVTAAIECKDWTWDGDQKEAAIFARDQARAALGETHDD